MKIKFLVRVTQILMLLFASIMPISAHAFIQDIFTELESIIKSLTVGGSGAKEIGFGPSVSNIQVLIYDRHTKRKVVTFPGDYSLGPGLSLVGDLDYFGSSRLGWLLETGIGTVNIKKQNGSIGIANFDSKVNGVFLHLNPVLFYRLGDKHHKGWRNWSGSVGVGYGITNLNLSGQAVANQGSYSADDKIIDIDINNKYYFQFGVHFRLKFEAWFVSMLGVFGGQGARNDDYFYNVGFTSLTVGRYFLL